MGRTTRSLNLRDMVTFSEAFSSSGNVKKWNDRLSESEVEKRSLTYLSLQPLIFQQFRFFSKFESMLGYFVAGQIGSHDEHGVFADYGFTLSVGEAPLKIKSGNVSTDAVDSPNRRSLPRRTTEARRWGRRDELCPLRRTKRRRPVVFLIFSWVGLRRRDRRIREELRSVWRPVSKISPIQNSKKERRVRRLRTIRLVIFRRNVFRIRIRSVMLHVNRATTPKGGNGSLGNRNIFKTSGGLRMNSAVDFS